MSHRSCSVLPVHSLLHTTQTSSVPPYFASYITAYTHVASVSPRGYTTSRPRLRAANSHSDSLGNRASIQAQ